MLTKRFFERYCTTKHTRSSHVLKPLSLWVAEIIINNNLNDRHSLTKGSRRVWPELSFPRMEDSWRQLICILLRLELSSAFQTFHGGASIGLLLLLRPHPQRHLDHFSRFRRAHERDQQTDRQTDWPRYFVCSNKPLSLTIAAMLCGLIILPRILTQQ